MRIIYGSKQIVEILKDYYSQNPLKPEITSIKLLFNDIKKALGVSNFKINNLGEILVEY